MLWISCDSASHSAPILLQEMPNSAQYRFQECTCHRTNSHFSTAKHGTSIHDTTDSEVIRTTAIMWRVSVKRAGKIILQVLSKYRSIPIINAQIMTLACVWNTVCSGIIVRSGKQSAWYSPQWKTVSVV